jgi:hypothetical protein
MSRARGAERAYAGRWLAAGVVLGLAVASSASAQGGPDLAGTWERNAEQSQIWQEKLAAVADPLGGSGDQPERRYFYAWLETIFAQIDRLEIESSDTEVKIIFGEDLVRIFYLNRKHMRQGPEGVKIEASAEWRDGDLVLEQATKSGAKTIERLSLLDGGQRLAHLLRLEDKRLEEPLQIRTVFDRIKGE